MDVQEQLLAAQVETTALNAVVSNLKRQLSKTNPEVIERKDAIIRAHQVRAERLEDQNADLRDQLQHARIKQAAKEQDRKLKLADSFLRRSREAPTENENGGSLAGGRRHSVATPANRISKRMAKRVGTLTPWPPSLASTRRCSP